MTTTYRRLLLMVKPHPAPPTHPLEQEMHYRVQLAWEIIERSIRSYIKEAFLEPKMDKQNMTYMVVHVSAPISTIKQAITNSLADMQLITRPIQDVQYPYTKYDKPLRALVISIDTEA